MHSSGSAQQHGTPGTVRVVKSIADTASGDTTGATQQAEPSTAPPRHTNAEGRLPASSAPRCCSSPAKSRELQMLFVAGGAPGLWCRARQCECEERQASLKTKTAPQSRSREDGSNSTADSGSGAAGAGTYGVAKLTRGNQEALRGEGTKIRWMHPAGEQRDTSDSGQHSGAPWTHLLAERRDLTVGSAQIGVSAAAATITRKAEH